MVDNEPVLMQEIDGHQFKIQNPVFERRMQLLYPGSDWLDFSNLMSEEPDPRKMVRSHGENYYGYRTFTRMLGNQSVDDSKISGFRLNFDYSHVFFFGRVQKAEDFFGNAKWEQAAKKLKEQGHEMVIIPDVPNWSEGPSMFPFTSNDRVVYESKSKGSKRFGLLSRFSR